MCYTWEPALPPKQEHSPQLSAHVCCTGETAGWTKTPPDKEVGLDPGSIVLDGDPAPFPKRSTLPNFWPISVVAKMARWLMMPLCREVWLGQGDIVLDGTELTPKERAQQPPTFRLMSTVAKWLDGSICYLVRKWPRPCRIVLDGNPALLKRGTAPNFRSISVFGQTVG